MAEGTDGMAGAADGADRAEDEREAEGADRAEDERETDEPRAACVLCQEPSEYPESHRGITLCPRCAWLEGQRTACSG